MATAIVSASVEGPILVCDEGLSVWGGVNPATGVIVDAHHPQHGRSLAGQIVLMPTSRGSCTGSGVLLGLAFAGAAPRALIFREGEDILTLGALVAARLFGHDIAVLHLTAAEYDALARETAAEITPTHLRTGGRSWPLTPAGSGASLSLSAGDRAFLAGAHGEAAQVAMEIIVTMAAAQGASRLIDVSRVHIDGCIYASPAFVTFARAMADKGGRVRVPTTMNAISVDHANWRAQGVAENFGAPAAQLADTYVEMGARPSFTCAPYLLADRPVAGEDIAWAESNAVIYANSVLGARTVKHADFMDLCIALTGRAAQAGVYLDRNRVPRRIIDVTMPAGADDAFWPMLGWLVGQAAPDRVPLIRGLENSRPSEDDLKALCAAYGTTSAAPLLHIAGLTPESGLAPAPDADRVTLDRKDFIRLWEDFNQGANTVDLVALGSPHFSAAECAAFAGLMDGAQVAPDVTAIVTLGRDTLAAISANGVRQRLERAGVTIIPDLCWCSISEPVFPPQTKVLMTNSGKYAHYAPGLSNRSVRFGSLAHCAATAQSGTAPTAPPAWIAAKSRLNRDGPPPHPSPNTQRSFPMNKDVFLGTIPALLTPCTPDRQPDFNALVRKGKELIAAGMSGVVYCGSCGDWPLLTDAERMEGVERLTRAGVPVVVGTGAINTASAVAHAAHAQKLGAAGLMVIPRVLSRGLSVAAQRNHFKAILKAAPDVPAIIYNSPYYGYSTKADLFFALRAEHRNLIGFKEFGGKADLSYAAEHITSQDDEVILMVGVDTEVYHGFVKCGAVGTITGIGSVYPKEALLQVALSRRAAEGCPEADQRARELAEAFSVLAKFDEGVDLVLYFKHLMVLKGEREYALNINETDALSPSQAKFCEAQFHQFNTWFANWSRQGGVIAECM